MAEPTLTPGAAAIAAIRPELEPETCERLALAVLRAEVSIMSDGQSVALCVNEAACVRIAGVEAAPALARIAGIS